MPSGGRKTVDVCHVRDDDETSARELKRLRRFRLACRGQPIDALANCEGARRPRRFRSARTERGDELFDRHYVRRGDPGRSYAGRLALEAPEPIYTTSHGERGRSRRFAVYGFFILKA